jgi:hypothetical protein
VGLIAWLVQFILKGFGLGSESKPSQEAVATREAGSSAAKLETVETSDAQVQKANDAGVSVATSELRNPDAARAPDPYSRD